MLLGHGDVLNECQPTGSGLNNEDNGGVAAQSVTQVLKNSSKRKPQIPWRSPYKSPQLYATLIRLALQEEIHLKLGRLGAQKEWDSFAAQLFAQPEFVHYERTTSKNLRKIYECYFKKRASVLGWGAENEGNFVNLSDESGNLNEVDRNIKQMLIDLEGKKEQNELKHKKPGQHMDTSESSVLSQNLAGNSNRKRKMVDQSNAAAKVTRNMTTSPPSPFISDVSAHSANVNANAEQTPPIESVMYKMFTNLFQQMTTGSASTAVPVSIAVPPSALPPSATPHIDSHKLHDAIVDVAGSTDPIEFIIASIALPDKYAEVLRMFGIDALLGEFCESTRDEFVEQLQGYGFNRMMAVKLLHWLKRISK